MNCPRVRIRTFLSRWVALGLGAAVVVMSSTANSARAETAVLLSPQGDAAIAHEHERAQRALSRALRAQATRVVRANEAAAALPERASAGGCDALGCAPALLRAIGGDIAVALAVWAAGEPNEATIVFVTLVDRRGDRYPGRARVLGNDAPRLGRAVERALRDARALQSLGPGPWLSVRGEPAGAEVLLDGRRAGRLPHRAPIGEGRHTLEVKREGYRPYVRAIEVPRHAARQIEIEVALEPRAALGAPAVSRVPGERESGLASHVIGPLILGGAGAALIAADIAIVLGSGCDRRNSLGHCERGGNIDEAWAIGWAGVGTAAIAGAVLWHMLGARASSEVSVRAGPGRAALVLSGAF